MKSCKLIISFVIVFAMILSFSIPCFAVSTPINVNFWDYVSGTTFEQFLRGAADGFDAYSDAEKATAYNNYVGTLPGNGFGGGSGICKDGYSFDSSSLWRYYSHSGNTFYFVYTGSHYGSSASSSPFLSVSNSVISISSVGGLCFLRETLSSGSGSGTGNLSISTPSDEFPYSGTKHFGIYCLSTVGHDFYNTQPFTASLGFNSCYRPSSYWFNYSYNICSTYGDYPTVYQLPYYNCWSLVPSTTPTTYDVTSRGTTYNVNTRVNNIVNNYSYTNNDGDNYTYITNIPIFDETTLIFTNPITGVSVNINDWWYDYCTRTYNLSYNDNDVTIQPTVQFGDSDITVTVGNDTYTYYYTVPDTSCDHTYVVSNTLDPTCTATGSKTYTCSKCQDTYTEVIPALGHDWVQGETVATTYNDDETVNQQGYTLYTCSRCGLEYYDYDGSGPPANDSEVVEDLNWLQRIYYKLCDILKAILGIDTTPEVSIDTATGTDIIVNVPGEDGEEDQEFKLTDFKDKFGFLHDIYDIISSFISDVSGDSQAAYTMTSGDDVSLMSDDGSVSAQSFNASSPSGNASTAPAIAIDFGSANSHYGYNYGGNMSILDLSWYAQYKPTVDGILSGFLWIFFIWGCFKHAPSIISGGDMTDNHIEDIKKGSK